MYIKKCCFVKYMVFCNLEIGFDISVDCCFILLMFVCCKSSWIKLIVYSLYSMYDYKKFNNL